MSGVTRIERSPEPSAALTDLLTRADGWIIGREEGTPLAADGRLMVQVGPSAGMAALRFPRAALDEVRNVFAFGFQGSALRTPTAASLHPDVPDALVYTALRSPSTAAESEVAEDAFLGLHHLTAEQWVPMPDPEDHAALLVWQDPPARTETLADYEDVVVFVRQILGERSFRQAT